MALITVSEAAKRCGVSTQTILNWGERGIITLKKTKGKSGRKWYHVDNKQIDELCNVSQDIMETKKVLQNELDELKKQKQEVDNALSDMRNQLRLVRTIKSMKTSKDFLQSVISMAFELCVINERERKVLSMFIDGFSIDDIGAELCLSGARILQLFTRACRRIAHVLDVKEKIEELDELKHKHEELSCAFATLKSEYEEMTKNSQEAQLHFKTEEEKMAYLAETDSLCNLLTTRLIDVEYNTRQGYKYLSVRALNCLRIADLDTLGDLVQCNKTDLLKFRNFGKKSLTEINDMLESLGLSFGMDVKTIYMQRAMLHIDDETNKDIC